MPQKSSLEPQARLRYQTVIDERLTSLSTAEQTVAAHLAAHPEQLPFETANSLAKRLGVSAMTVGRMLKALGYRGLADLRRELRSEMPAGSPWRSRGATTLQPAVKSADRSRALTAEIEAIEEVHALAGTPAWRKAVECIADAKRVFVAGFQTERGLAIGFADQLAYLRSGVRYFTVENRSFADLATEAADAGCLVIIDSRRYSRWFRLLAEKAVEHGIPLVIVTDAYCSWASNMTPCALRARTDSGRFWDNNASICSLLNLLLEDVVDRLGEAVHERLDAASDFGGAFMGFERVHRQRHRKPARGRDGRHRSRE